MAIESGAYIQTYVGDYIIASKANEYTDIEKQITGMDILVPDNFKKYVSDDVVKAIVLQHPDKLAKIEKAWREKINNTMYMTISKPFFLEFMNKDVDKSKSIERLADMLGISMSQVIAVGDSYNDLSMIKSANKNDLDMYMMLCGCTHFEDVHRYSYITYGMWVDYLEEVMKDTLPSNRTYSFDDVDEVPYYILRTFKK